MEIIYFTKKYLAKNLVKFYWGWFWNRKTSRLCLIADWGLWAGIYDVGFYVLLIYKCWNPWNTLIELSVYNIFCWNIQKNVRNEIFLIDNVVHKVKSCYIWHQSAKNSSCHFRNISTKNIINRYLTSSIWSISRFVNE